MILRNTNLLVDNLYYLLWLKDSGLKDASFNVKIPDTIILQSGKIMNWFFSSKNGEGVLMKKDFNLKNTKIFESFTRKESKSGIVALFIENIKQADNQNDSDDPLQKKIQQRNNLKEEKQSVKFDIPKNEGSIVIRYLSKENLKELLFTDLCERRSGILQKFIDPYGENQSVIQAIWSPQLCIFSKRVNYRHLFDKRYDPYERLPTFDGAEMYSRTVPLRGKVISQEMRKFCENIVQRIAHVSFQKIMIQRMVVYFKADKNNNLYFLYCSSLRLNGEKIDPDIIDAMPYKIQNTPLTLDTNYSRPEEIKLIQTTNTMRPISLENNLQCFHCQQKMQTKDLVPVTYEFIINNFEENPNAKYSKVSNIPVLESTKEQNFMIETQESNYVKDKTSEIPELLTKLYPKLTVENYLKFRQSKKFLNQKIKLCQYCYLDFTRYIKMSGAPLKGEQDFRFMKKGLSKKGSLFTREMKAIVAAKNVEMADQKGSEFVKYQNKEVYQRMLDHLMEEMEIINREKKKKNIDCNGVIIPIHSKQLNNHSTKNNIKLQDDLTLNNLHNLSEIQPDINSSNFISNKQQLQQQQQQFIFPKSESCTNFNTQQKLKEIQKQITLFEDKLQHNDNNKNNNTLQRQKSKNQSTPKSKQYLDNEYLELNDYDPFLEQFPNNQKINESKKFINPEKTHQQSQIEQQYKLNAHFIQSKKQQLNLNQPYSIKDDTQKRPSSTTINSSNYRIQQNSTKDSHPISSNHQQHYYYNNNNSIREQQEQQLKRVQSFTLNKPYRIQTANSNKTNTQNIGNTGSISSIKSPSSTKYSSQTALHSNKQSSSNFYAFPQKNTFSTLSRPQSHYVQSNQNRQQDKIKNKINNQNSDDDNYYDEDDDIMRVKTDENNRQKSSSNQEKYIKKPQHTRGGSYKTGLKIQQNEMIVEQLYDDLDIPNSHSDGFHYENLDFDFHEVNDDYCNQKD